MALIGRKRISPKKKVTKKRKVEKVYDFEDEFSWCADPKGDNPPVDVELEFDNGELVVKKIEVT